MTQIHEFHDVSERRGFTLIELLVVIAIISLLTSILLPSLQSAKKLARSVQCMSNQKQVGLAMLMAGDDHEGHIPLYVNEEGHGAIYWSSFLTGEASLENYRRLHSDEGESYIGNPEVTVCPSWPPDEYQNDLTYGAEHTTTNSDDPYSFKPSDAFSGATRIVDLYKIQHPSNYWLITDSYRTYDGQQTAWLRIEIERTVHLRHLGSANMLFADGRVENVSEANRFLGFEYHPITCARDEAGNIFYY